jgi:hypothetical protein
VLEAVVPYSAESLAAWLGGRPDQFCSPPAARAMAVVAWRRARTYGAADSAAAGVSCTAGLATDRPKRGGHRAHVAVQTLARTVTWSLELTKGARSRAEEEDLVCRVILNAVAEAGGIPARLELALAADEPLTQREVVAPQAWQDLFAGRVEAVRQGPAEQGSGSPGAEHLQGRSGKRRRAPTASPPPEAIFPGAFDPLHAGHRRMAEMGREILGRPVAMELSIVNADKPPLSYAEIQRRLAGFPPGQAVWLTRAGTFEEKSRLFPAAVFLVGSDTLRRIAEPRYYPGGRSACLGALRRIAGRGCRLLVFGRDTGQGFVRLPDLDLPKVLAGICREVPPNRFRDDISSTAIRREGSGIGD